MPHNSADHARICLTTLQRNVNKSVSHEQQGRRLSGGDRKVGSKELRIDFYLTNKSRIRGRGGCTSTRKKRKQDLEASRQA